MQAPTSIDISVLTSMASFPSVDHFMFPKFHLFLFFVTHFPPFRGVDLFQRVDKNVEADFGWTSLLHNWDSHTLKLDNLIV